MALRREDLEVGSAPTATIYRFPVERPEVARIRRGIASRRAARRRHRAGLAAVVIAVVGMTLMGGGGEATAPAAPSQRQFAVVQPGETLWDIAERHAPDGMDVRVYVETVAEINDIGPVLQAGARLRLP